MNSINGMKFNAAFPSMNNSLKSLVSIIFNISKRCSFALAAVLSAVDLDP